MVTSKGYISVKDIYAWGIIDNGVQDEKDGGRLDNINYVTQDDINKLLDLGSMISMLGYINGKLALIMSYRTNNGSSIGLTSGIINNHLLWIVLGLPLRGVERPSAKKSLELLWEMAMDFTRRKFWYGLWKLLKRPTSALRLESWTVMLTVLDKCWDVTSGPMAVIMLVYTPVQLWDQWW